MQQKKQLASEAIVKALQVRKKLGLSIEDSVSALDAAERLGIDVRLVDLPSMEGMYVRGNRPTIILSTKRPSGRRSFTCAHEIGHHIMGHGEQFDELVKEKTFSRASDPKEFQADCFAAFFLMPKVTVENGMKKRGFTYEGLDEIQVFQLASWLGVSYRGLVTHLVNGLGTISRAKGESLQKRSPKEIRQQLVGDTQGKNLIAVDLFWTGRAVDCEMGDVLILPNGVSVEGESISFLGLPFRHQPFRADRAGISRITLGEWSSFVRVSSEEFKGRACYRFEEEVEE